MFDSSNRIVSYKRQNNFVNEALKHTHAHTLTHKHTLSHSHILTQRTTNGCLPGKYKKYVNMSVEECQTTWLERNQEIFFFWGEELVAHYPLEKC